MSQTSSLYRYSSAIQALVLWSSWAFYVNYQVSLQDGINASLVQGVFSFCATLVVISAVTKIYNTLSHPLIRMVMPTIIMVSVLTSILIVSHSLAGTPEIAKTIIPSLSVAALFCAFTTYKLSMN